MSRRSLVPAWIAIIILSGMFLMGQDGGWGGGGAPQIIGTVPANGATGVSRDTSIILTFNVDMDTSDADFHSYLISIDPQDICNADLTSRWIDSRNYTLELTEGDLFHAGITIIATFSNFQGSDGIPMEQPYTLQFTVGTTEINGVCNEMMCELIEPEQQQAEIELTGSSSIHMESDFFSEFTSVDLCYPAETETCFDITEHCEIRQRWSGGVNYIEVHFNTADLPIGPGTWAYYTITLHPMPPVPPDAKTSDSLWILTNGRVLTE